ncbi:MAG: deoxyribose-phosphate aldolase [Acidobacteria bacterium]|nr:deoxyribose-phosphate aldolase [Acidobacteriota bacterium]
MPDQEFTFGSRPPLATVEQLAKMIDHSLLRPELDDARIHEGLQLALAYDVASVCVRPSDVDTAATVLQGSAVAVGSVCGFPHGDQTTGVKLYEARDLLRRGAREVDAVLNIGKLISRQFQYVEMELLQLAKACHEAGALLKVIFENAYLTDELKVVACKISKRAEVDYVKTSSGFAPSGYTKDDLLLMKRAVKDRCKLKAAGGVRTIETALEVYQCGCDRFGATQTAKILDDWKVQLAAQAAVIT